MTLAGGPVGQVQGWRDVAIVAEDSIDVAAFLTHSPYNVREGEELYIINDIKDLPHEVYPRVAIIIHEHLSDTNNGEPRQNISDNIFRMYSIMYERSKSLLFVKPSSFQ
jgi:hypothetical protein